MSSKLENTIRCGMSSVVEENALFKGKPNILRRRCLRIRHASSSCTACIDACSYNALYLQDNQPILRSSACVGCGACESACPTEAVYLDSPSQEEIFEQFKKSLNPNKISFVCKQVAAEPSSVQVGCYVRIRPDLILLAAALGTKQIELISGNCESCALNNRCRPAELLEAETQHFSAIAGAKIPLLIKVKDIELNQGRRRFLSAFLEKAQTAEKIAERNKGVSSEAGETWKKLPDGHLRLVSALNLLVKKNPEAKRSEEKEFYLPNVSQKLCSGCLLCVSICPTGSLSTSKHDKTIKLFANTSACIACKLCSDVCHSGACEVSKQVSIIELSNSQNKLLAEVLINPNLFQEEAEDKIARMFDAPVYRT